jgi:hypothetical protein
MGISYPKGFMMPPHFAKTRVGTVAAETTSDRM